MSHICNELHSFVNGLPRYRFPFDSKHIPKNGIYVIFETGERGHGGDRIVRIGTHTGNDQLRSRLNQHFIQENKDRSIFRKNIGRCLLHRSNDPYLEVWELDCTSSEGKSKYGPRVKRDYQHAIEEKVSQYIQQNFTFCVLEQPTKEQRLYLESRIVSTVSSCTDCGPSATWLGLTSPHVKIQKSGLWQVNELYKQPLNAHDLKRMVDLIP
jgi:hypothetical protein